MGKIAYIFSGQGAQYPGMGKELYNNFGEAKEVFEKANKVLGFSISDICFSENPDELNRTENTQPAILTLSTAALKILEGKGHKCAITAGLSLGEYSALVCAGALEFEKAVALVRKRGKFMDEAVPNGVAGMAAILGLSAQQVEKVCKDVEADGFVQIANLNCPGQIVIGGEVKALEKASDLAKEMGAKRVIRLEVGQPFHTAMLSPAADKLANELEKVEISPLDIPVVTNVTGECIEDSSVIKELLEKQVKSPVYFEKSINTMIDYGVDTFVEIGPGKALSGFVKKVNRKLNIYNIQDMESLEKTIEGLDGK